MRIHSKSLGFSVVFGMMFCSAVSFAVDGINPGPNLTTGPSSNHFSLYAASYNPAMAPLVVPADERFRFSYLPSISIGVEIGDVANFADDLDELIDLIETPESNTEPVNEVLDRFNAVLARMGQDGYIKNSANVGLPGAPFYFRSEGLQGTLFFDVNQGYQASVSVLDDTLSFNEPLQTFTTDTSIYLKSGIETKYTVGYGRQIDPVPSFIPLAGKLYAGAKLNFYQIELSKQVTRLEDLDGEEVSDVIKDEYDKNLNSSSNIGIDVGLLWDADWYQLGVRLDNINSPAFEYGDIGTNCDDLDENTIERNSCEVSRSFIADGRLKGSEKHTKHALLRVDGMLQVSDRWFVSSGLDLAEYDDIVGYENQWLNLAMSYESVSYYVPSARVGYQMNLAGTKLSSYTMGFTFFKTMSLDFEMSSESAEVDGNSAPRRFGFSLAFTEHF
ncbi:MAG: conjugal transfer protein TraF [Agarilytica sp.]